MTKDGIEVCGIWENVTRNWKTAFEWVWVWVNDTVSGINTALWKTEKNNEEELFYKDLARYRKGLLFLSEDFFRGIMENEWPDEKWALTRFVELSRKKESGWILSEEEKGDMKKILNWLYACDHRISTILTSLES